MRLSAPAKVNLALHVTSKRADGYHLLDSLVVFADVGDWLEIAPSDALTLTVTGPKAAGVPDDARNLVWRAAEFLAPGRGAAITLEKHLPHAGGIGGGSADAAAALRGLSEMWGIAVPDGTYALGADVPACLGSTPCRTRGIGDLLDVVPPLPELWIVLVNPGVEVPTGAVFNALDAVDNAPLPEPVWDGLEGFSAWLAVTRNDLEAPAMEAQPVIGRVLEALARTENCLLARMSGSGATCFGLYSDEVAAIAAAAAMPDGWWAKAARLLV